MTICVGDVVACASNAAFGRPLVTNVLRSQLVEAMIALTLGSEWRWCAGDYGGWDFERSDGLRIEVKQSAYRQTWAPPAHGRRVSRFDIRPRQGRWEGATFVAEPGRAAHLYVFAHHNRVDEAADHRDPGQWQFHVVLTGRLPASNAITLLQVQQLAPSVIVGELAGSIATVAATRHEVRSASDLHAA